LVDTKKHNEWFIMAKKDMRSANILFEHNADNEIICFHCQQAIEKYIKGYILYIAGELQEGHNLVRLCKKVMVYDSSFSDFLKDVAFVITFYIETRYPAEESLFVSIDDTKECIDIMNKIVNKIDKIIG
jgi:HEPN domain-containing protein